jgi:hypothetical protein
VEGRVKAPGFPWFFPCSLILAPETISLMTGNTATQSSRTGVPCETHILQAETASFDGQTPGIIAYYQNEVARMNK